MIVPTPNGFEARIGPSNDYTLLGVFATSAQAQAAYDEADAWATEMCGHYQRSCESGDLLEWELETGDGFGDLAHVC